MTQTSNTNFPSFIKTILGWLTIVTFLGACTPVSKTTATQALVTLPPSIQVTVSPTPIPPPTSSSPSVPFPIPRAEFHNLLFSNSSETEQSIYSYNYETATYSEILTLPTDMSLHQAGRTGGLLPSLMFLSPDAKILVALQHGINANPIDFLHQIDLITGQVVTIKLHENGEWAIPIVDGRRPGQEYEDEGIGDFNVSISGLLNTLTWSPDSSGFFFTLGKDIASISERYHYNGQIYYVPRGSTIASPLAVEAPGNDIGFEASWSPNGNYLIYVRDLLFTDLWLIDMQQPSTAVQLTEEVFPTQWIWISDNRSLLYTNYSSVNIIDTVLGSAIKLVQHEQNLGEFYLYDIIGETNGNGGVIIIERHEINTELDLDSQKLRYIDLETKETISMMEGEPISEAFILPVDGLIWVTYDEAQEGAYVKVPSGEIILGPSSQLHPPTDDEIQYGPSYDTSSWYSTKSRSKSSDLHLIAGYQGDEIVIWDIQTGGFTVVAGDLSGKKVFLGWVPDLDR